MSASDLSRAQQAGAKFASSPASPPEVLDKAAKESFPFIPGIATPTELLGAVRSGFHLVKFFPAVPFGGAAALRAFEAPFPHLKFIPTGGTSEAEFDDWLGMANVIAVGGAWLAPREEIARKDFETIASRARYMVAKF